MWRKCGQDEAGLVDIGVVVLAKLHLLLGAPLAQRRPDIDLGVFATNHETNLARRIGRNSGVRIFSYREVLFAVLLELGDQWEVKPLVFGYIRRESQHANKIKNRACPKEIRADVERCLVKG